MRYLILSDIHANLEALEAVLAHAAGRYDKILCCGDVVGYGADPNPVIEWTRANSASTVRGNHDKACAGIDDIEWFNPAAKASAMWTREILTEPNRDYLRMLPKGPMRVEDFDILHGSPVDEDEYLIETWEVAQIAEYVEPEVSFFGHTHLQGGFMVLRGRVRAIAKPQAIDECETMSLEPDWRYLINPGSVGQPRDGDPRAGYAVYIPEQKVVSYYRIPYHIERAQSKIRQAGLPESLATRLAFGH